MLVLDTDVVSALERGPLPRSIGRHLSGQLLAISFVTLAEAHLWRELRSWGPNRRAILLGRLESFIVLPYDEDVAVTWARLTAGARRRGRPRPTNDTWIAACCVAEGIPLLTLNQRDFKDFAEHDGLVLLP